MLAVGGESYLIDTCTMLDWKTRITGTDSRHSTFREVIWSLFQQGRFNISTTVVNELGRSPRLIAEIEKRDVKAIALSSEIKSKANQMMKRYEERGRITGGKCVSVEDLQIILTAKHFGLVVITEEAQGVERCNIPTVCRELGVRCMNSKQLFKDPGFLKVWR